MWIVPKTLSAFVQDTEGWSWESSELAWMLEQSAMWRSKPSSKQTWWRRLKKDAWMTRLSTRILKPSLRESFEEKYTEFVGATLVSRSVAQESEKERKTQDTCGPISESMSGQLDLFGAFSRMSEVTPRWGYGESCPIWKKMVTERSGDCTQRRKQARLTNASDASSWQNYPTPTSRDWKGKQANEYKDERGEENNMKFANLPGVVDKISNSNWATPNTMDYMETRSDEGVKKLATGARKGRKRPSNLREQVDERTCQIYKEQNWPTPRTGGGSRPNGKGGKVLNEEVQIEEGIRQRGKKLDGPQDLEKNNTGGKNQESWLTASARDWKDNGTTKPNSIGKTRGFSLGQKMVETSTPGKLNPNWVEQLMGLQVGWTQLPTAWTA